MLSTRVRVVMVLALTLVVLAGCEQPNDADERVFLIDSAEHEASRVILDDETRVALAAVAPSRLTFDVRVPTNPVLRFAIATRPEGEPRQWPPVEFRVLLNEDGGDDEPLFEESLNRDQAGHWLDREVELAPWAGRRLNLVFETRVDGPEKRVRRAARRIRPLWGTPVLSSRDHRPDRPNVVLVSIDCLRADHVGAYGYPRATTPALDSLADDGTVFEAVTSASSWTLPTHLSMLTGLLPSEHGVRQQQRLSAEVPFLPALMADAGYRTDGVAAWYFLSQSFGFDRGFHSYKLLVGHDAEDVIDTAIDLVRKGEGGSQFLFVHLIDPHWPYEPPAEWVERFGRPRDISDVLARVSSGEPPADPMEAEEAMRLYDGEIAHADEQLGRLIETLKARDLYDDALIIVTGDHGEAFYEHGHWEHTVSLYDEVTHVPLIVKWPEGSSRGPGRVSLPVSQVDIFPTILREAGVEPPQTGASSLKDPVARPVVSELTSPDGYSRECDEAPYRGRDCVKLSVRVDSSKLIATLAEEGGALRVVESELYDLGSDPSERDDSSGMDRARVERLTARLRAFLRGARARASKVENVILDEETTEKLRALGYIR